MNVPSKTISQLEAIFRNMLAHCPSKKHDAVFSDLYFCADAESGELVVTDDDDRELARGVVSAWRNADADGDFLALVERDLREVIGRQREALEAVNFLHPYSLVLVDENHETLAELYIVDDDTMLLDGELMAGLDEELDAFFKQLMED